MLALLDVINSLPVEGGDINTIAKISSKMGIRLVIDLITVFVLVRLIYFPIYKHREYFFMFVIFNLIIFLVSFLLNKVELSMGAAFGLFAVFSMLRYRTENVSIKDMTYLFLFIAVGLVTAVTKLKDTPDNLEYLFLVGVNGAIVAITYLLESHLFTKKEVSKLVLYENIELIQSGKNDELLADLKVRTGFNVHRVSIQKINFLKDSALIKVYYYE